MPSAGATPTPEEMSQVETLWSGRAGRGLAEVPNDLLLRRFALRLPEDLHTRLTAQAAHDRRSTNSEILHLLEVGLAPAAPETPDRPDGDPASAAPLRRKPDSSRWEPPPVTR